MCAASQVYEKHGSVELSADDVMNEFASQYPGEDKELIFGAANDYDDVRKVSDSCSLYDSIVLGMFDFLKFFIMMF